MDAKYFLLILCFQIISVYTSDDSEIEVFPSHFPFVQDDESNRIIGGVNAGTHEFPSIISLQYQFIPGQYNHTCTGSIVNQNWMVTAGHCSFVGPKAKYRVLAGAHNLYNFTGSEQIRKLADTVRHPYFSRVGAPDYDISMMMFDTPLIFNQYVQPIAALAPQGYTPRGEGVAAGWGLTAANATSVPATLQKIALPIVDWNQCKAKYNQKHLIVTTRFFCGGGEADRNVCHGDSGGPFYVTLGMGSSNTQTLAGITSWGYACALSGWPSVFTSVGYFHDWIQCVAAYKKPLTLLDEVKCWSRNVEDVRKLAQV